MKVLYIVTAYPRHEGDVITPWMGETIARLQKTGTEVEVLAPAYRGSRSAEIGGVMVHRFRYAPSGWETLTHDVPALDRIQKNVGFAAMLPGYIAAGSAAAARIATEGNFEVVHAFWPIPHGLFGLRAKARSNAALVSTFFSSELNWTPGARKIFGPILRRIVRGSDVVTVISSFTGKRLREYVPNAETVTIPFGAAAANHRESVQRKERQPADPFELIFVGRLVRRKGVDVLLQAVSLLVDDPRLTVRVIGGGPEKPALEAEAARLGIGARLSFEGVVDSARIDSLFATCDALVLPAIVTETGETEGLGVVLLEAMGYGKLVIASAAGGIVDIVADRETGLLVAPGNAKALADAIRTAMDQPREMGLIAERGAEFAEETFGWDAIVAGLNRVYEKALTTRASRPRGPRRYVV